MKVSVEDYFDFRHSEKTPPLFFPSSSDPLCASLSRRAAHALFERLSENLFAWHESVTTMQLVDLPEYAYMGTQNLELYNRFLLMLSEKGWLPIRLCKPDARHYPANDWLWHIDDEANASRVEEEVYD